jgi:hypothetical protein
LGLELSVLDPGALLGGVNDPKFHPPPLVTAKDTLEVDHRERTAVEDQNRTVYCFIPVYVTAKHVVAQRGLRIGGREGSDGDACPNLRADLTECEVRV